MNHVVFGYPHRKRAHRMNPNLPLVAAGVTVGFNEPEDRLVLIAADAAGGRLPMLMTRRLTHRLLNGLASLVERSSVVASKAPADLRDDIILMEHQDAVFGHHDVAAPSGPAPVDAPAGDLPAARLVTHIDVTVTPQVFLLVFRHTQQPQVTLSLTRLAAHRMLEAFSQQAEAAGWNLTLDAAWLEPGQTEIVFN